MKNVLLIGNGFDLAHGLLTSYNHFLYLAQNWDRFYSVYQTDKSKKENDVKVSWNGQYLFDWEDFEIEDIKKYTKYAKTMDEENIKQLGTIIKENSWIKYYCNCGAEIDGWIDFEREIYPVLELFTRIFSLDCEMVGYGDKNGYGEAYLKREAFSTNLLRIATYWDKYINTMNNNAIYIKAPYASLSYGILKREITKSLRKDFEEFIYAYEIYLTEFVYKRDDVVLLEQIVDIDADYVVSFNYTLTELLYGIDQNNVHHIHGEIRENMRTGENNMVMGVNRAKEQYNDFIYFVKYFQRLQKKTGVEYKKFLERNVYHDKILDNIYCLHIYGHSLDMTDEDILKYMIGEVDLNGDLILKPKEMTIYYYNAEDYEQKIINLFSLYGHLAVEKCIENQKIKFVETTNKNADSNVNMFIHG